LNEYKEIKMPQWFTENWIVMTPLSVCSVVGLAVMLERIWALRRRRIISPALAAAIQQRHNTPEKIEQVRALSETDKSVLGELAQVVFVHASLPKEENLEAVQAAARQIMGRLERGLTTLALIVELGPLLGLLGTVIGMVKLFTDVAQHGLGEPAQISRGIYAALTATMVGLGIAVPALVAVMYLRRRVELLVLELERHTGELLRRLYRSQ
jgi:biopolymer transport protein ExbB